MHALLCSSPCCSIVCCTELEMSCTVSHHPVLPLMFHRLIANCGYCCPPGEWPPTPTPSTPSKAAVALAEAWGEVGYNPVRLGDYADCSQSSGFGTNGALCDSLTTRAKVRIMQQNSEAVFECRIWRVVLCLLMGHRLGPVGKILNSSCTAVQSNFLTFNYCN